MAFSISVSPGNRDLSLFGLAVSAKELFSESSDSNILSFEEIFLRSLTLGTVSALDDLYIGDSGTSSSSSSSSIVGVGDELTILTDFGGDLVRVI